MTAWNDNIHFKEDIVNKKITMGTYPGSGDTTAPEGTDSDPTVFRQRGSRERIQIHTQQKSMPRLNGAEAAGQFYSSKSGFYSQICP